MRAAQTPHEPPADPRPALRPVESKSPALTRQGGSDGEHLDPRLAIDLFRGLADQEIARAEAARSRARQAFALAAGFFAVVQTVAFGTFVTTAVTKSHHTGSLIDHATVAAVLLGCSGLVLLIADS